ncbi:T-cell-specific guanine nucleotide triphosphate-binding protein 2-like [Mya arenaria]|uniref:T-cell-specific guanine nucleotide triphosphate-binding protein 2-like n=1 Tax=Mya arenaria TaxID=6604 RepID=UPI0022E1F56B|nr:T-cell-specific guanine nucleotide triphosphate-binding protein 2-like [Mya arenaria]
MSDLRSEGDISVHYRRIHLGPLQTETSLSITDGDTKYKDSCSEKRAYALYDFDARDHEDLSFRKGDVLILKDQNNIKYEGWCYARHYDPTHQNFQAEGYVPMNYVALEDKSDDEATTAMSSLNIQDESESEDGEPGTGKSAFINSIRGLKADDPGAAEVSLFETTMNLSGYPHPDNPNLRIVGELTFTRDNYLQKAALSQFDFLLLLSASRFKENDIWLAKEFLKLKPNFHLFFVRTKIDDDLRSSQKGRRKLQTAEDMHALQQEIKEWARLNLVKDGISNANIYIVNNYDTAAFDFGTMYSKLMQNVSRLEREAMIMATKEVVQTKLAFLKSRISLVSQTAAEAAVFATAVTNKYPAEIYVLLEECRLYRSQLGLNLNSLEIIAKRFEIDFEELLVNLSMTSYIYVDCEDGFANFYTRFGIIEPKI